MLETNFDVAQIEVDDVKLVLIFIERAPDASELQALERAASAASLEGEVIPIWSDRFGRTRFMAAPQRHAFLRVVDYAQLRAQINASIPCSQWNIGGEPPLAPVPPASRHQS